jgi:hypothetical protein
MEYLTESEAIAIAEALESGALESLDNRSDGAMDSDPLGDSLLVGARIAEGFALINALNR